MAIEKHAGGPGSSSRAWDLSELTKCGAINTTCQGSFNLDGEIHPIFNLWEFPDDNDAGVVESLVAELDQPLLLASRILETAGLPWLSELLIRDIHDASYPGRTVAEEIFRHPADSSVGESAKTPDIIVRHFDNPGIPPSLQRRWLRATSYKLQTELPKQIVWHLDGTIFDTNGWVGYTCRHPRRGNHNEGQVLSVPELDRKETIEACDAQGKAEGASGRSLTVLVMRQYAARLMHLRKLGRFGGEEYILTAFMAAVTLLHELGHAAYWRDFRAKNARMTEPYFGGDLEMELGDSFVAHIFGGWVPVPIASQEQLLAEGITFKDGLAWRQHLTRDLHKTRPRYRAHYSVQVKHVASLFDRARWVSSVPPGSFIRPEALAGIHAAAHRRLELDEQLGWLGLHAGAALPDFQWDQESMCYCWRSSRAAPFRIPQYQGAMSLYSLVPDKQPSADRPGPGLAQVLASETGLMQARIRPDAPPRWGKRQPSRKNRLADRAHSQQSAG